jgi:hypothetical protein
MTTKITEQNISELANAGVQWQSPITADGSTVTTAVAGRGYFIDTTSATHTINLPVSTSVSIGDTVKIAQINGSNDITIGRNGNKINGGTNNGTLSSDGDTVEYVFVNVSEGFKSINSTVGPTFISATGGTVSNSGDFRIHTFTGDGNFVVASLGNGCSVSSGGPNVCDYLVVAGGGGGGKDRAGGGGAGGFRESKCNSGPYTASPLATPTGITLTAATFPVTVGGGGAGGTTGPNVNGTNGSNSIFSTITSAGGGGGMTSNTTSPQGGGFDGGSGGGGGGSNPSPHSPPAGIGNTPSVSPPQGQPGGEGQDGGNSRGAGGGGATAAAANASTTPSAAPGGGAGATTNITGSPVAYAGGGGGTGTSPPTGGAGGSGGGGAGGNPAGTAGTANTGGGGGGSCQATGAAGGKGIVIIRYKFQ